MQGIPCIYQGIDQGFDGFAPDNDRRREYVRETMWGKPDSFSNQNEFYKLIRKLSGFRNQYPALRYGRQYFRECSGNGIDFGFSSYAGGIISYSRILNNKEMLICANTSTNQSITVYIVVDENLNPAGRLWKIIFSSENDIPVSIPTTAFEQDSRCGSDPGSYGGENINIKECRTSSWEVIYSTNQFFSNLHRIAHIASTPDTV